MTILTKIYDTPPTFSEKEALRYAKVNSADDGIKELFQICKNETLSIFTYKVCYCKTEITVKDGICDFGFFNIHSRDLCKNLYGCSEALILAATVGLPVDRLIAKYSRTSPSKALMIGAIGAERIEALCDRFTEDIEAEFSKKLRPRFSPGYGDLPLEAQNDIFRILDVSKK